LGGEGKGRKQNSLFKVNHITEETYGNYFDIIAILLCFFVLWISFTANVRENGWEFSVLCSLELTG
jgi:hypothetical protein